MTPPVPEADHQRARKLAALTAASGPEGTLARQRLRKMIHEHPALAYLDCEDPMGRTEHHLRDDRPGRAPLLRELCFRYEVALAEIHAGQKAGYWLIGRKADVLAVLAALDDAEQRLAAFLENAARAWTLFASLPPAVPRSEAPPTGAVGEEPAEEEGALDGPQEEPEPEVDAPTFRAVSKLLERAAARWFR